MLEVNYIAARKSGGKTLDTFRTLMGRGRIPGGKMLAELAR